ncbi:MAG: tetratricopeptide repeat protein [Chitinophagaceae bacterium]
MSLHVGFYKKKKRFSLYMVCIFLCIGLSAVGQQASNFPAEYNALKDDKQKVMFLKKVIDDSINEGQLASVREWSKEGIRYIDKLGMDTLRGVFFFYIAKSYTYYYNNFDTAIVYYKKVLPYYATDTTSKYYVLSIREIMENFSSMGNKDSTFRYVERIEAIMDSYADTSTRKIALAQNIATVYSDFSMFKTALKYYQFSIDGNLKRKNYRGLGMALANVALVYNELGDDVKAIQYSKEAARYLADNKRPLATTLSNISDFYFNISQFDSARIYLDQSNAIVNELDLADSRWVNANSLAAIYIHDKKYEQAREILNKTLAYFSSRSDQNSQLKTLLHFGELDSSVHNYASARKYLEQALDISRKTQYQVFEAIALQNLTKVAKAMGDYKSALAYHEDYMTTKDSLNNEKTRTELAELEISYHTSQKEQQIELLKKENDIKSLQLQNNRRSILFFIIAFSLLLVIAGIIFYQRNLRHRLLMQKVKAELETKVLRSQMNPHFIFNTLNSIENFMMQNEKRQASDYLNKFSMLIRNILDSSREEMVSVSKDVESLQLYVDLEQLRFNNKFSYKTYIDPELVNGDYQVPSLLVQPYVENAILHGLAHSKKDGLALTVTASLEDGYIKYVMQDNGIGRKKSEEYKQYNRPRHKSVGLQITEDRITMFNQSRGTIDQHPVITDLWDEQGNAAGTKVEIKIKAA